MFSKLVNDLTGGPKDPIEAWKQVEDPVVAKRVKRCNESTKKILGNKCGPKQPKVGLCFSGGGWRAMSSGCAVLDALATPLSAESTDSKEEVKVLDTISHAFGLSGGSWCLFTALAGGNRNVFHSAPSADANPSSNSDNPWIYGSKNYFDANKHQYEGLRHIVYADTVNAGAYRGKNHSRLLELASKLGADSTLGEVLLCEMLGDSLVERWSNFLANDVLNFVDHNLIINPNPSDVEKHKSDPNRNNHSRKMKLGDLKGLIESGDFPFVVCSAISDVKVKTNRMYNWVEFSPYFVRNVPDGIFSTDVNHCKAYFSNASENKKGDDNASELNLHHIMGVCGSAFACDLTAVVGPEVAEMINKRADLGSNPLLGRGLTRILTKDEKDLGNCRDAGVDFNIPLPPMLTESHRDFDVVIVMDAGANSVNAYELKRAVDLGYIKLADDAPDPNEKYAVGERVRVFRGAPGYPSVIYFLGLTKRATSQIIYPDADICGDLDQVRDNALKQLIPVLLEELRSSQLRINDAGDAKPKQIAELTPVVYKGCAFRDAPIQLRVERDIVGEVKKETAEAIDEAKKETAEAINHAKAKMSGFMSGFRKKE